MEADSAHPLECADLLDQIETTETNAFLRFGEEPDTILRVCCWRDEHRSDLKEEEGIVFLPVYMTMLL